METVEFKENEDVVASQVASVPSVSLRSRSLNSNKLFTEDFTDGPVFVRKSVF